MIDVSVEVLAGLEDLLHRGYSAVNKYWWRDCWVYFNVTIVPCLADFVVVFSDKEYNGFLKFDSRDRVVEADSGVPIVNVIQYDLLERALDEME